MKLLPVVSEVAERDAFTNVIEGVVMFVNQWTAELSDILWKSEMHILLSTLKTHFKLFVKGNPSRPTTRKEFVTLCSSKLVGVMYKVSCKV